MGTNTTAGWVTQGGGVWPTGNELTLSVVKGTMLDMAPFCFA